MSSIKDCLYGPQPFYKDVDYMAATRKDFDQRNALPVSYKWETESKIIRIVKKILAVIVFPILIYQCLHALVGRFIVPASNWSRWGHEVRRYTGLDGEWKYKRFTVEVDGQKVDAMIMGQTPTFGNGRWVLASNGNGEFYECKPHNLEFKQFLNKLNGNALVFNYPGVGASEGSPNRQAMAKAYRAMLALLEDQKNGIGASEIIGYGHSLGGGIQADGLNSHQLKEGIRYTFVKSRTFSNLSSMATHLTGWSIAGCLIKLLGWNIDTAQSSKRLKAPEIILQTAQGPHIVHDGVIPKEAALAEALLKDPKCSWENKTLIRIEEDHNEALVDPSVLTEAIETSLAKQAKPESIFA